jgi:hypothetical protein
MQFRYYGQNEMEAILNRSVHKTCPAVPH